VRLRAGTSGFNYDEWKESFYPPGLPAARRLAYYAGQFDTVEINATFYRMPTPKTLAAWAAAVPAGFAFGLKAPQRITHFGRLRGVDDPVRFFCETALTLGDRLGPLLFQLPPNFPRDLARLADFLALLPSGLDVAMEFRHDSWLDGDVYERLRARNVALCVADTGERTTPLVSTADFGYFRLRDEGYAEGDLERWAHTIRQAGAHWRAAWVFFKHEESGTGPAFARRFRALFG
jgi:uncharacterized protein YecE (DUF72 family)